MKNILILPLLLLLSTCGQRDITDNIIIDDVGVQDSVFPKLEVFENSLTVVSQNHVKGNEVIKELRKRVDELLVISEAQKIKYPSKESEIINQRVVNISQYITALEGVNEIQADQIQIAINNLNEVEKSLFKKENEAKELRSQNELLRKRVSIAIESENIAREDALKSRKKAESLKKYRTIFYSVVAAFGLFLIFKLSAAGRLL